MSTVTRFNIGDIIKRLPSSDPYDKLMELVIKYGELTYLVMDINEIFIQKLNKTYIIYKLMCMQTNTVSNMRLSDKNLWKKIG